MRYSGPWTKRPTGTIFVSSTTKLRRSEAWSTSIV